MTDPGIFTLSLDTELAWGSFDTAGPDQYADAYRQTPSAIERLCNLLVEYDVPATWAFVAHLFEECRGHTSADTGREQWLSAAPCSSDVDQSLWYDPGLLETVTDCAVTQDAGLHGYSHLVFDEHTRTAAREELVAARETAERMGIEPSAFVYPRNRIEHEDLLGEYGIEVFRGVDARWYEQSTVPEAGKRPLRYLDETARVSPQAVVPFERAGVVCVPGSQIFRPNHGAWAWTPSRSQVSRARKGLDRAARTGGVFHLWFHPFNIARNLDDHLSLLADIFEYADRLRDDGRIECLSLTGIAREYRNGRWNGQGHSATGDEREQTLEGADEQTHSDNQESTDEP